MIKKSIMIWEYIERITVYNKKIELTVKVSFFFTLDDGNLLIFGGVGVDTEKRRTPDIYTVGSSVVPVVRNG